MGDIMSEAPTVSKGRLIGEIIGVLVVFFITMILGAIIAGIGIMAFFPEFLAGLDPTSETVAAKISLAGYPIAIIMMLVMIHFLLKSRGSSWQTIGLSKPDSIVKTIGFGILIAVVAFIVAIGVEQGMSALGHQQNLTIFSFIEGDFVAYILMATVISWFAAGLGEEVVFRGLVMRNLAEVFGGENRAWIIAAVLQALIFGAFHMYQDIAGGVATGTIALIFGLAYYKLRSLWPVIIAHGLIDTYGMTVFYLGVPDLI